MITRYDGPCYQCEENVHLHIPGPVGGPYALAYLHRLGSPLRHLCDACVERLHLDVQRPKDARPWLLLDGRQFERYCDAWIRSDDPASATRYPYDAARP
jgi:hypothetical protein